MTATLAPTKDLLMYDVTLPLRQTWYPLGFPVNLSTNSEHIVAAGNEVWGQSPALFPEAPLELRFAVDTTSNAGLPPAVLPRAQGHLLSAVFSSDNYYIADLSRGFAYGWFTPSVVREHPYFRYHFLESAVYVMLNGLYLTPIHAACVGLNGAGVLLCGQSGAGKSSLSYACARAGWEFICDDASHLLRRHTSGTMVLGKPHYIRFRESARALFPELVHCPSVLRGNGKMDIESSTADLGLTQTRWQIPAGYLVFLNRDRRSRAALRPYSKERAREFLLESVSVGEPAIRQEQLHSLERLLEMPVFELTYSDCPGAEHCLRNLVEGGGR